jgi:hypothetical protein
MQTRDKREPAEQTRTSARLQSSRALFPRPGVIGRLDCRNAPDGASRVRRDARAAVSPASRPQRQEECLLIGVNLFDLSEKLARIGDQERFQPPHGRGDELHHGSPGSQDVRARPPRTRDNYIPDLDVDPLKLKPRNFR